MKLEHLFSLIELLIPVFKFTWYLTEYYLVPHSFNKSYSFEDKLYNEILLEIEAIEKIAITKEITLPYLPLNTINHPIYCEMEFIDNSINTYCKFTEEELFDLFYDENLVHNGNYKISPLTPEFYRFEDVFNYYHKNYSDARKYYKYKNIKILWKTKNMDHLSDQRRLWIQWVDYINYLYDKNYPKFYSTFEKILKLEIERKKNIN